DLDVHRPVRSRPHRGLDRPVAGNDGRSLAEDRPPAPALHRPDRARLRADPEPGLIASDSQNAGPRPGVFLCPDTIHGCPDTGVLAKARALSCHSIMTQPNSARREIIDMVRTVAIGLTAAVAIQTVAFQPYTIPSASMEPGLLIGDYLVVSKFAYGWSRASLPFNPPLPEGRAFGRLPARGDVVVFRRPSDPREVWIKRVIGLPGDRIEVIGGTVVVNGVALPQRS